MNFGGFCFGSWFFLKSCKAHCDIKCKVCSKYIYFRLFQAERERDITVEHLADIDRLVNESLQMLSRFQDLNTKVSQKWVTNSLKFLFFFWNLADMPHNISALTGTKVNIKNAIRTVIFIKKANLFYKKQWQIDNLRLIVSRFMNTYTYHKVASSRVVYYSISNSFGQRSHYISIKFPLHKPSENH